MGTLLIRRALRAGVIAAAILVFASAGGAEPWHAQWNRILGEAGSAGRDGDPERAEALYRQALAISVEHGEGTLRHARSLDELAYFHLTREEFARAEEMYGASIRMLESLLGPEQPRLAMSLHNLGAVYVHQHREEEAEPLVLRALEIWERSFGPADPNAVNALQTWSVILRRTGRHEQADEVEERIRQARSTPGGRS